MLADLNCVPMRRGGTLPRAGASTALGKPSVTAADDRFLESDVVGLHRFGDVPVVRPALFEPVTLNGCGAIGGAWSGPRSVQVRSRIVQRDPGALASRPSPVSSPQPSSSASAT
jgi:hypothetical protein